MKLKTEADLAEIFWILLDTALSCFSMFVVKKKIQKDIYSNFSNLRIVLFINESLTI